jgi:hypothetical protein
MSLRKATIRLAHENPSLRSVLLPLLAKRADQVDTSVSPFDLAKEFGGLQKVLQRPRIVPPANPDDAKGHGAILSLLRRLQAGDKVVVTYIDNMRGGEVKTQRVVAQSWQDLRAEYPGKFNDPMVLLEAKVKGRFKGGMIRDYGDSVLWQPTMSTQVTPVLSLKKV